MSHIVMVNILLQGLDEQQSVQLLQCYLQEDYRGTRDSLKVRLIASISLDLKIFKMWIAENIPGEQKKNEKSCDSISV